MNKTRTSLAIAAATVAALALTACGSSSTPAASSTPTTPAGSATGSATGGDTTSGSADGGSITIGSANFAESELIMNIYADALKAKGVSVTTKPKIGAREVYIKALQDGSIDLVPEYSGTLLAYFDKTATAASSDDIYKALPAAIGSDLKVLDQSQAQDKDSIGVTAETAAKFSLKSIADLKDHAADMTLGAAPEFKTRADGVPGLKSKYGVVFGDFKTLDAGGPLTVAALKNGQIDAADIFTTDPSIDANKFVILTDLQNLYTAQNVLPLISAKKDNPTVDAALNAVSAKLTTDILVELNAKTASGTDSEKVASDWLTSVGLG